MWFQDLHAVGLQEFVHRVVGILQIDQLPCARRTGLAAGRGESLGDAVVTKRARGGSVGLGIQEAAAVRAGLDAVATSQAVLLVDQNHTIRRNKCRSYWADLRTGRVGAVVAHLGNVKVFSTFV